MDKKVTGIIAYIGLIGWIIAYIAGDRVGAKFHLNQALVLALAELIVSWIPVVGGILGLVLFIFAIMGIVSAAKEEEKELPLIGGIKILK